MHVRLAGISKHFGGLAANDRITLEIQPGEIHALLGENGAGKTTLMKILYGLYQPDKGEIFIDGCAVHLRSPHDALMHKIGMVHQHFMLVPTLSVGQNCAIGREQFWRRWKPKSFAQKIMQDAKVAGLHIEPNTLVSDLSVGQQQRVEIVRALGRGAQMIILDEPTAVLTPQETDELLNTLRKLAGNGTSVIFISHKLKEVMKVSDRISILRAGKLLCTVKPDETTRRELALLMIGRQELTLAKRHDSSHGIVALQIRGLRIADDGDREVVHGVSFDLRAGEVLGVAGVDGNGQTELAHGIVGLNRSASGSMMLDGIELIGMSSRRISNQGVGYITEDQSRWGLFPELSIAENLVADRHDQVPFASKGVLKYGRISAVAADLIDSFDIRPPVAELPAKAFSGGNKQKVMIARALARDPRVLIVCQPTRGVDVGAAEYIRQRILDERKKGCAILLISADLDEVLALSDRIAVMYEGRFMATLDRASANPERIGLLMAGAAEEV